MLQYLTQQRSDLTIDKLRSLIEEKKQKIGAGYLTEQGALFLVAADLGISLDQQRSPLRISDVYVGAKDVTLYGRILTIYSPRQFARKDNTETTKNRTMVIYDDDHSTIKIKLWDNKVQVPEEMGLRPGDMIKLSKGYVKSGLDGKPFINVGMDCQLEKTKEAPSEIPDLNAMTRTIENVDSPADNIIIEGYVRSNPRMSDYRDSRGNMSKSLQLQLFNEDGTKSLRTIIWNVSETRLPKVFKIGSKIRLIGVRIKSGNPQYGNGDFEIHGDEGTVLSAPEEQTDIETMTLRLVSIGSNTAGDRLISLGLLGDGKLVSVIIDKTLVPNNMTSGSIIECVPSRIFGTEITLTLNDSYIRILDEGTKFPSVSDYQTKISDVVASNVPYIIEAIVLQQPNTTQVNTRSNEMIEMTDTLVGDDSGEIRLIGWRDLGHSINSLALGDRIRIIGAVANNGLQGTPEITLKPYSSIMKINSKI
jgi:replication factor A1